MGSTGWSEAGLDIICPEERYHGGQSRFEQAGYVVYCSGACGDNGSRNKGQDGVGMTVREKITQQAVEQNSSKNDY